LQEFSKLAHPRNYKGFVDPSLVLSIEEAQKIYKKNNVLFIDTRNYWKYVKGHIPGAFNLELYAFHWIDTSKQGLSAFARQMEFLLQPLGINEDTLIVFYQNNSGYDAARGVWLLNWLGHRRTKLLDGGLNAWKRKSLPTSTEDPTLRAMGNFAIKRDDSIIATFYDVLGGINDTSKCEILDTRTSGKTLEFSAEPGDLAAYRAL